MQIIAQGWLVYELSHSELALGIVSFASAIPALLVTPWGGVLGDRVSNRKILIITQTLQMLSALILAALTFSETVQVWHIVVLAGALGFVNAVDGPARQAFVVDMVGRADMPNAIAVNSMTFNSARIFGPAVGGLLLSWVGADWCFLLNGISFLAVIAGLAAMTLPPHRPRGGTQSPLQQMRSGVVYAMCIVEVKALLAMAFVLSTFGITYSTVMPAFVKEVLNAGPEAFGTVNAGAGVGAILAAVMIASFGNSGKRGIWLSVVALLFPIVLTLFAWNRSYYLAIGLALLLGIGFMSQFTLINTLLQTRISDEMRGRVLSLYTLTFFGFTPFGNLAIGAVAERWGLSIALSGSALITLILSAWVIGRTPELRALQ